MSCFEIDYRFSIGYEYMYHVISVKYHSIAFIVNHPSVNDACLTVSSHKNDPNNNILIYFVRTLAGCYRLSAMAGINVTSGELSLTECKVGCR